MALSSRLSDAEHVSITTRRVSLSGLSDLAASASAAQGNFLMVAALFS